MNIPAEFQNDRQSKGGNGGRPDATAGSGNGETVTLGGVTGVGGVGNGNLGYAGGGGGGAVIDAG